MKLMAINPVGGLREYCVWLYVMGYGNMGDWNQARVDVHILSSSRP